MHRNKGFSTCWPENDFRFHIFLIFRARFTQCGNRVFQIKIKHLFVETRIVTKVDKMLGHPPERPNALLSRTRPKDRQNFPYKPRIAVMTQRRRIRTDVEQSFAPLCVCAAESNLTARRSHAHQQRRKQNY